MEDPIVQHAIKNSIDALFNSLPEGQRNIKNVKDLLEKMISNGDIYPIVRRALPHDTTEQLLKLYAENPQLIQYADDVIYEFDGQDTTGFDIEFNLNFYLFHGLRNYVIDKIDEYINKMIDEEQER